MSMELSNVENIGRDVDNTLRQRLAARTRCFVQTYVCSNTRCKSVLNLRLFPGERVPEVLNCWNPKCRAGYGLPSQDVMKQKNQGMFPLGNAELEQD